MQNLLQNDGICMLQMIFQLFRVYVEYHRQFPPIFNKNGIIGIEISHQ